MDTSRFGEFLAKLYELAAKDFSFNKNTRAEELLLVALRRYHCGREELSSAQRQEFNSFSIYMRESGINAERLQIDLLTALTQTPQTTAEDIAYFERKLSDARFKAQLQLIKTIPAGIFLRCIMEDPSPLLYSCLEKDDAWRRSHPQTEDSGGTSAGSGLSLEDQIKQYISGDSKGDGKAGADEPVAPENTAERSETESSEVLSDSDSISGSSKDRVGLLVEQVKEYRSGLLEKIFGQDNAVSIFINGYFQGELMSYIDEKRKRPKATFLFAGPPGVGKTYLAECAAEALKLPFKRFDMTEYSERDSVTMLCGSDGVFKDSQPGTLTSFVADNPKCVLLFDEIEKADLSAIHLFLQILDAGRLRDANTRKEVSFTDAIVILTTNAGKTLYEESETGDMSGLSRRVILKALEKETNPATGLPFFPAAICSRFASGNVIMFNHMAAHHLRDVSKSVISTQGANLEKAVGIKTDVDDNVYTALLLAEGGHADARTIRGRSESFYSQEIFELLRIIDTDKTETGVEDIDEIYFGVQLPENNSEIRSLFEIPEDCKALVYAPEEAVNWCRANQRRCEIFGTRSMEEAQRILKENDIQFVLLDMDISGMDSPDSYLSVEDVESGERDFLWFVREKYTDMPLYLLTSPQEHYTEEEALSFRKQGVRGFISIGTDGSAFENSLAVICENLHQQKNISLLAKANKVLTFETGQKVSADGKIAGIYLFDFELSTAVEAEDSRSVLSSLSRPDVTFDQVIGAEEAKKELKYFVDYLKNPKKFMGTGVGSPKGVLLYGPPGTGKTMLAKALASEAGVTYLAAEGNQFFKKYVGEGPESVHELFRAARKYAPSIIFVDEFETIARERGGSEHSEISGEILTAFLTEMDGFRSNPNKPVFVLAATNFDAENGGGLDGAILRRFDRRIRVELPNREERRKFLRIKLDAKPIFSVSDAMVDNIALRSTGMSLAALESVIELSMRMVIRDSAMKVSNEVFEEAFESFNSGNVRKWDPAQLRRVAVHEAGHAFLSWKSGDKPSYLTIVARGDHGGYMQHGDNEDKMIFTRRELLDRIRCALGGRAAETVFYGEDEGVSTGASGDLATATAIAKKLVCSYGMSENMGLAAMDARDIDAKQLRDELNAVLSGEMERAIRQISGERELMEKLVGALLDKNRLTGKEIDELLSGT